MCGIPVKPHSRNKLYHSGLFVDAIVMFAQATKQLKVLLNDPGVVPALCSVLVTSRNLQVISSKLYLRNALEGSTLPPCYFC